MSGNAFAITAAMLLFGLSAWRHKQGHWLLLSVLLWSIFIYFGWTFLPDYLRWYWLTAIFRSDNYLIHSYIFVGSLFFWTNNVFRLPERSTDTHTHWRSDAGIFLTLLALASLAMHVALGLLALVTWWEFPDGLSVYFAPVLWQLYALQPAMWWLMTLILMFIFLIHRRVMGELPDIFSLPQIYGGILLAALFQFGYIIFSFI